MSRLIGFTFILALAAALVVGGSWALAYNGVATLLGDPPPQMGIQTTTFLWDGLTQMEGAPRVWCFAYYPTLIPGAQSVRIYVTPMGRVRHWTFYILPYRASLQSTARVSPQRPQLSSTCSRLSGIRARQVGHTA